MVDPPSPATQGKRVGGTMAALSGDTLQLPPKPIRNVPATLDACIDLGAWRKPQMYPASFDGCFGWLHVPPAGIGAETAVVLCPGLRSDALTGYRSLRRLGDALAEAGFPTLRFHYPNTLNSNTSEAAEHWTVWQLSVHGAANWLRHHSDATRIVLCGLRFGAMLAASVASTRSDIAGLILLAGVLRGRSYIRQLTIEAGLPPASTIASQGLVLGELAFLPKTLRLIDQVDLRRIKLQPKCRVAVYMQTKSPTLSDCLELWGNSGIEASCFDFTGLEGLLQPTFMIHQAPAAVDRVVTWLRGAVPAQALASVPQWTPQLVEIRTPAWVERPLRFSKDNALFGILCRPSGLDSLGRVVIIANASGDPHCAPISVDLARRLAISGIASLRIDFEGIGDSIAPDDRETHVFETDRSADFSAAVDALSALGYRQFAVQGLCSGAYHAFYAALADPRFTDVLLVNLPLLEWQIGYPIELLGVDTVKPMNLMQKLRSRVIWMQALSGDRWLRERLAWWRRWIVAKVQKSHCCPGSPRGMKISDNPVRDRICQVSRRARLQFLFAENDPGLAIVTQALGSGRSPSGVIIQTVPGLNHSLSGNEMRRVVAEHAIEFLRQSGPLWPKSSSAPAASASSNDAVGDAEA
jgi:pimeloyl-ACP methyl ester carboxylesterase